MSANAESNDRLRGYLLGVIPWEDASDIEQKLLGDADFYEELLVTEDELVDLYVADRLPLAEKQRFESHFLTTTERKQKTRFAKLFAAYLDRQETEVLSTAAAGASVATEKPRKSFWPALSLFATAPSSVLWRCFQVASFWSPFCGLVSVPIVASWALKLFRWPLCPARCEMGALRRE